MSRNEIPTWRLGAFGSVRTRQKIQSACCAEGGPGLLAVDDVVRAVPHRPSRERRQVRSCIGLGKALAPPDVKVRSGREEASLLVLVTKLGNDWTDHRGVERERLGDACELHLSAPDGALHGSPIPATPFDGPVRDGNTVGVEDLLRDHVVLAAEHVTAGDALTDVRWHVREHGPHLVAELSFCLSRFQVHRVPFCLTGPRRGTAGCAGSAHSAPLASNSRPISATCRSARSHTSGTSSRSTMKPKSSRSR